MASSKSSLRRVSAVHLFVIAPTLAVGAFALAACGDDAENVALPIFEGGLTIPNENDAGDAAVDDAADAATPTDGEVNDTSTIHDSSTDGATTATNLVISQVQSRGTGGGDDEFVEIYNPTAASITFDSSWTLTDRNATGGSASCANAATTLYTGIGQVIASHKHLLIASTVYSQTGTAGDGSYSAGISDAASVVLVHSSATVDAVCFGYASALSTLTSCSALPYVCEGTPVTNPHDNTTGTDTNASIERKPGGTGGNATDTNDNANDFSSVATDDPHDLASAAVP